MSTNTAAQEKLRALMAASKARKELEASNASTDLQASQSAANVVTASNILPTHLTDGALHELVSSDAELARLSEEGGMYHDGVLLNYKQASAVKLAEGGKSFVLIGAAGTGKTTSMKAVTQALITSGEIPRIGAEHNYLPSTGWGIVIMAFTNRAVRNIARNVSYELRDNCITTHKLLEFQPVVKQIIDDAGNLVDRKVFEPNRNKINKLPATIKVIILEEASMEDTTLFQMVLDALPDPSAVQFIFLGDIQQLPPVFGDSILGYMMTTLPTIELTEVYRQALGSPIIKMAHRILSGKMIPSKELPNFNEETDRGKLQIIPWTSKVDWELGLKCTAAYIKMELDNGRLDFEEDIVLCPYNISFGTIELNNHIANHLARKRGAITYEIVGNGYSRYYSVGDRVMWDKREWFVEKIVVNARYMGRQKYQEPSMHLDYWGCNQAKAAGHAVVNEVTGLTEHDLTAMLESVMDTSMDEEERKKQASHVIHLRSCFDHELTTQVQSASSLHPKTGLIFAYAMTVHKAQGSEWRRVILAMHSTHNATSAYRELLYTACTRAKQELTIICEPDLFIRGINIQRIKGNTLEDKIAFFNNKKADGSKQVSLTDSTLPIIPTFKEGEEDEQDELSEELQES